MNRNTGAFYRRMAKRFLMGVGLLKFYKRIRHGENRFDDYNAEAGLTFYKTFLKKGDLVYDVGANKGNRVATFHNIGCKVIAVEPQEDLCNKLRKMFTTDSVIVENIGLGEQPGQLEYC